MSFFVRPKSPVSSKISSKFRILGDKLAVFVQISSKIANFVFSSKMLNFAISFVFRPKRISCVPSSQWRISEEWLSDEQSINAEGWFGEQPSKRYFVFVYASGSVKGLTGLMSQYAHDSDSEDSDEDVDTSVYNVEAG